MKSVFLFSTKLKVFLIEIPPTVLLVPAIIYNNNVKTLMKLYPLIIALLGIIIFSAVYFFRAVKITNEEIRCVGPFSTSSNSLEPALVS